jgi:hypothetical protein
MEKLPPEIIHSIRYEWIQNPKQNYDNLINYLNKFFKYSCGNKNGCRFNKLAIYNGEIICKPVLLRYYGINNCSICDTSIDIDLVYCYKHAPSNSEDFSIYHSKCNKNDNTPTWSLKKNNFEN